MASMIGKPEDAVIARVVKEWMRESTHHLGRTKIQKLMYFIESLGVPLNLDYEMYHYGPYSQDLADKVDWLEVFDILEDRGPYGESGRAADYKLGPKADELLQSHDRGLAEQDGIIRDVVDRLTDKGLSDFELLATAHFVCRSGGADSDRKRVIREVRRIKGNKFTENQIHAAVRDLIEAGWMEW